MTEANAQPEKAVFRHLAIPVSVFDHIKDAQRAHAARYGEQLTINETVSQIIREHRQNVEREGRTNEQVHNRTASLLRRG